MSIATEPDVLPATLKPTLAAYQRRGVGFVEVLGSPLFS